MFLKIDKFVVISLSQTEKESLFIVNPKRINYK